MAYNKRKKDYLRTKTQPIKKNDEVIKYLT